MVEDLDKSVEYNFELDDSAGVFSWDCENKSGFISLKDVKGVRLIDSPGTLFDPQASVTLQFISNTFEVSNVIYLHYTKDDKRNIKWMRDVFAALKLYFKRNKQ